VNILFEENGKLYRFDGYEESPPEFKQGEPGFCYLEQVDPTSLKPLGKQEAVHVHDCLRAIAEIRNEIMESSPCIDFIELFECIQALRKLQKQSKKGLEKPAYQMIVDEREDKLDTLLSRINKLTGGAE
jgi:hypothetical protein